MIVVRAQGLRICLGGLRRRGVGTYEECCGGDAEADDEGRCHNLAM